jgi:capsular exopolysaccharide synthesis family protein
VRRDEAAAIANEVREAYDAQRQEIEAERIRRLTQTLDSKIKSSENDLEAARIVMNEVARRHGIVDNSYQGGQGFSPVVTTKPEEYSDSLRSQGVLEQQVIRLKSQLESLMKLEGDQLIANAASLDVQNDTIKALYPEYQKSVIEESRLLNSGFGKNHPKIRGLRESIVTTRKTLETAVSGFKDSLKVQISQAEQTLAKGQELTDTKKLSTVEDRAKQSEYATAKTAFEMQRQLLQQVKEHSMKTAVDKEVPRKPIEVLQVATPEPRPSKPNVMLLFSIGAGLGLVLGLLLAFFLEYLDTSVKSLDDVERYLGVPVLAVIPKDVGVLHKQSGLSPDAEAYRILRTNIEFNRRSADANAITIVSGGAGEGKSTTLVNLAYICAQGGYNTLMIDGDLRRPKLHTFFDINNSVGLTNYLTTALMLEDVILQTPIENLYFMPSGILPADAAGILNSRRMSELIADVKNRFDLVLIDSPPILGVSDASVLASEVDLTIIVIQHRKLPRSMLLRVKQAIENVGGNLLGVVLNNVDVRSDSQYQYYTSYYTYYSPTNAEARKPRQAAPAGGAPQRPAPAKAGAGRGENEDY